MRFGTTRAGVPVDRIDIAAGDLTVGILTWGAVVHDVRLAGIDRSLTLGSDHLADYEGVLRHHGALIGPIAGRISNARVKIDGMMYELERNQDGRVHLHSGREATHLRTWVPVDRAEDAVTLRCDLADGDCGLPGNRSVTVTYRVTAPAVLTMEVTATTDATTVMNFANHSYWNLDGSETWSGHALQVHADTYLPADADGSPTGEIAPVAGSALDFRAPRVLHAATDRFNHNLCLSDSPQPLRDVATLQGASGVAVTLATTCPGLQIFDNSAGARPGRGYFEGVALEAQHWPDAPNNPKFPSMRVQPGTPYRQTTRWTIAA